MNIPAPAGLSYLPYQLDGIRFALGARGTLIADEMGLGKTVQAIGIINASPPAQQALIICPAGLRLNWQSELATWRVPGAPRCFVHSYHEAENIPVGYYDIVVIDEIHYCKNPSTLRSQALAKLAKPAKRVIGLTGTPMPNSPIEIWPILQMVCPEKWDNPLNNIGVITQERKKSHPGQGINFWNFAAKYCDLKMTSRRVGNRYVKSWDLSGASNLDELRTRLRKTCMVRRLKADVLPHLPEKRHQIVMLESKANDADLVPYEITEENYFDTIRRLRTDKVLFEEWSKRRHEQALKKVDDCIRFIGDALEESRKLIVFAHHADVIAKLVEGLDCEVRDSGDYVVSLTGKTSMNARKEAVDAFQNDPECTVIVGSIGAMGTGFTLTAAAHEIFVEMSPVPGEMNQAVDRAHRIGQKESVLIQYLVADGSLCARMMKILVKKQAVLMAALDTGDAWIGEEGEEYD